MNAINLNGMSAVITGGAQGIGYAVAERLLQSGAQVSIWDMDSNRLEEAKTMLVKLNIGKVHTYKVDIVNTQAVKDAYESTCGALGKVDILVHSAGIAGPNEPLAKYPAEEFRKVIDINVLGTFNVNQAVINGMIEQNYGRIVNIASVAGKEGNPNASAYSASKAASIAMTKSLGKEVADKNISVNCVTPAAARTRIFDQMSDEHINYMLSKIPRNRFLEVNEAAAMIAWLVSSENSFTTASTFDLSGGRATY
ncbi:MAG: SDR family oxidoreductase [Moritella sp.]|uniref:SDR family NAD(P)-dependent oxidoreductase n=1 Tax=Moritella sp. TaxID=78556 RepID=UPI0025E31C28|nr:SDR family NAD(P)-dependent oxidoreductase [Moritella sp.]NQZ92450.1 SDR family oxidoreductase [Moritella sp.]